MNERIKNLLEMGRLVEDEPEDAEIVGTWANALRAFDDARVAALSAEGRLVRAFDAGRIAAHTIVRAHNYRVRAANHHEVTIAVAGILSGQELTVELQKFESLRKLRTQVEYGWQPAVGAESVVNAIEMVKAILDAAAAMVRDSRPALSKQILTPS